MFENYQPAPISCLLPDYMKVDGKLSELEIQEMAHKLEKTLLSFNICADVVDVKCGPSVTRFEIALKPGTKVSKVVGLQDDIMLALAAYSIRMEAPVPGKYAIAIEIPNENRETVFLRGLVDNEEFMESSPLTVPIGLDVSGNPVYCDIAKMPHLLIAGSAGSGKSVCVNTILSSILVHSSPEDVRMILVDPKIVELYSYKEIPHLLMPVINEPEKAVGALKWAVIEMQRRYRLFEENGVRNIKEFNEKHKSDSKESHLPCILFVIDELAELMRIASGDVEEYISRLAALARAAGIHLIIATQIPSPCVITGAIKANIGSRIAFAVTSGFDSRTILDHSGAEKLIGRGDMLYAPMTSPRPVRCQGIFITDSEVDNVVGYLKKQYGPSYDETVIESVDRLISDAESDSGKNNSSGLFNDKDNTGKQSIEPVPESIVDEVLMNEKKRIRDILVEASKFYYKSYTDESIGKAAREYVAQRGIPKQTIDDFVIGYSPVNGTALYDLLKEKGFNDEEMLKSGIFAIFSKTNKPYDIFHGRLIFPIFDASGNVIAFGGRALGDERPKYLNSADSLIYSKQNNLYAINIALKEEYEQFILVEGYMDVLSLYSAGVKNAVAVLGLSLTDNQIKLCSKYGKDIVFFFDSDEAGQKATLRAIEMLMDYLRENICINMRIKIANISNGKGPSEFISENGPEKIKEAVRNANYVEEYLLKRAREDNTDPFTGVLDLWKYQEDICRYASWMNDEIKISRMAGVAAPLLGATQDVVMNEIQRIIKRREEENNRLANINRSREN